jgi:hypothetical protein
MMRTEYKTVNSEDASHVESDASRFEQSVNNGRFLVSNSKFKMVTSNT